MKFPLSYQKKGKLSICNLSEPQKILKKMKKQFAKTSIGGNVHAEEENNRQL